MNDTPFMKALQTAPLHSLLMMTSKALSRAGFGHTEILDRRQNKQKSRYRGHEILCETTLGDVPVRVIVKVVRDTFRVRMFDELAGAVQRRKADFGLLVSPFESNEKIVKLEESYGASRIIPFDGPKLAGLLSRHNIGVRESGQPDYAFLDALEEMGVRIQDFISREAA